MGIYFSIDNPIAMPICISSATGNSNNLFLLIFTKVLRIAKIGTNSLT